MHIAAPTIKAPANSGTILVIRAPSFRIEIDAITVALALQNQLAFYFFSVADIELWIVAKLGQDLNARIVFATLLAGATFYRVQTNDGFKLIHGLSPKG